MTMAGFLHLWGQVQPICLLPKASAGSPHGTFGQSLLLWREKQVMITLQPAIRFRVTGIYFPKKKKEKEKEKKKEEGEGEGEGEAEEKQWYPQKGMEKLF